MQYDLEKQHIKGKLHAIERIELLVDRGSFMEIESGVSHDCHDFGMETKQTPYDGVITGFGIIDGKQVGIYAQDFTVMGGSLGYAHGKKIARLIELCIESRCPCIGINDSGGARIQEGIKSLAGYGEIFYQNTKASGYIPQISIIAGPCAGGAVYSPGLTDFVFVIDKISHMFVTGPKVVKAVMQEDVTSEQLGGAAMHAKDSGVAHVYARDEKECFEKVKKLLRSIPHCSDEHCFTRDDQVKKRKCKLENVLPQSNAKAYNVKDIITKIFDENSFFEIQADFAKNSVVGFAKLVGIKVGIVANQPNFMGGALNCDASDKIARFVNYCDAFEIPLVTMVDVPGYLPGSAEEKKGIIRHGAKVLYAYSRATTPKITLLLRKAFGGAYIAMCSKHLGADFVFAWPSAEIAVMGAQAAVDVLYAKQMKVVAFKEDWRNQKIQEYNEKFLSPNIAVKLGYVDDVIRPQDTRDKLFMFLWILRNKKAAETPYKRHGNMPL